MQRLLPDPAPVDVGDVFGAYDPAAMAPGERPFVYTNFAVTLDGHSTIDGRSGPIGSATDTEVLMRLRERADAVMIGAGTLRAERYGRVVPSEERRERRVANGLAEDPLAVIVSGRFDIPWEAPLFSDGDGEVLILTAADGEVPDTATPVEVVRHDDGVDLTRALRELSAERGIRALLSEGGPHLHGTLLGAGLVDELFVTIAGKIGGGAGPGLISRLAPGPIGLELRWLLEEDGELYTRWAVAP